MSTLLEAAKQVVDNAHMDGKFTSETNGQYVLGKEEFEELRRVVNALAYQESKYQERKFVVFLQCLRLKAKRTDGKNVDMIIEPGDKARHLGYDDKYDNMLLETTDPGRYNFKLPVAGERRVWEWTNE